MDRGVDSCIYCHDDIMMTEYTRFYSTIHLISKSASRFGHLNILKWLSLKIYKLSHFILSSICNYTIYAIILCNYTITQTLCNFNQAYLNSSSPHIQRVLSPSPFNRKLSMNPLFYSPMVVFFCSAIRVLITRTSVLVQPLYNFKLSFLTSVNTWETHIRSKYRGA